MQSIGFFFIATTSGMIDATKAIPIVAAKSIATSFTPKLNNETFRVVCANVELNIAHPIGAIIIESINITNATIIDSVRNIVKISPDFAPIDRNIPISLFFLEIDAAIKLESNKVENTNIIGKNIFKISLQIKSNVSDLFVIKSFTAFFINNFLSPTSPPNVKPIKMLKLD